MLLTELNSLFLMKMYYSFEDAENTYFVMDLMRGGDLHTHLSKNGKFTEE